MGEAALEENDDGTKASSCVLLGGVILAAAASSSAEIKRRMRGRRVAEPSEVGSSVLMAAKAHVAEWTEEA